MKQDNIILFCSRSRTLENILPASAALRQHTLRAAYQAGHVWGKAIQNDQALPSPADWGW